MKILLLALLLTVPGAARAQERPPLVVMNLAAHPDDEDGSTLTYYRKAKDAAAYSVIFTRGEGGQNEIGPELYEKLGAIRTRETERAARILGTQVYFLNFYDFGFSKHAHEAFEAWGGRDTVTARLVYLIRKLKPDVLFTNHDTVTVGPRSQHGHHQAVGLAAYDAFALAADSAYHPEQLEEEGVGLWQPKRLFLRHWREPEDYDVAVPVGAPHEPSGQSYTAFAMDALREHESQGMGMFVDRFRPEATYFTLLRSATDAPLDSADLAGNLSPNRAAEPDLSYGIDSGRLPAFPEGTLTLDDSVAVPGQTVILRWDTTLLPHPRLRWEFTGAIDTTLYLSDQTPGIARLVLDPSAGPTVPVWKYQYERFLNHPPVTYAAYHTVTGDLLAAGYLPLDVAPPLVVSLTDEAVRLRPGLNRIALEAQAFHPLASELVLNLAVARDSTRDVIRQVQQTAALPPDDALTDTVAITLPAGLPTGAYTVLLTGLTEPAPGAAAPARAQTRGQVFPVKVPPALKVGVIESYDDTMAEALSEMGADYVLLDSLDLARGRFDGLHTIIVDIRAYLVRPALRAYNDTLLDWVAQGGHLVVNYQKTFEWNADSNDPFLPGLKNPPDLAPYPLQLGRDRVTREDAPVEVLAPDHVLFHEPNEITEAAWAGWVQERGLYFPETYDAQYLELFSMNDPGEAPLRGSTLLAHYGEGTYLYTALVWYRQLKQQHPGAYRLFANLISLPLVDGRFAATSSR